MADLLTLTKELCKVNRVTPARSKGQNFLIKEDVYDKIIEAADLQSDDIVLEVGPGFGFLTAKLAQKVKQVIAVELDDKLAEVLRTGLMTKGVKNVEVVNHNILDFRFQISDFNKINHKSKIINPKYKIVANLPYNISSVFLRKFLTIENKPSMMVLMLQKEVAERITAQPGKMSLLAVSVQFYAQPEIIEIISRNAFWPEPAVDSAIIAIRINPPTPLYQGGADIPPCQRGIKGVSVDKEKEFFRMVKFGFSSRRKMLKNNLAGGYHVDMNIVENWLKLVNLNSKIRAQELSIEDWLKLFDVIE